MYVVVTHINDQYNTVEEANAAASNMVVAGVARAHVCQVLSVVEAQPTEVAVTRKDSAGAVLDTVTRRPADELAAALAAKEAEEAARLEAERLERERLAAEEEKIIVP